MNIINRSIYGERCRITKRPFLMNIIYQNIYTKKRKNFVLLTTNSLPITFYSLPTTLHPLPTTYFVLLEFVEQKIVTRNFEAQK